MGTASRAGGDEQTSAKKAGNPKRLLSARTRRVKFRKKFTAKQKKTVVAAAREREERYSEQQAQKKQEWKAAIVVANRERNRLIAKKKREDKRLHQTRMRALQHQRAVEEKRTEEEMVLKSKLLQRTEEYEKRLQARADEKQDWIRLGGGRVIRPEDADRYRVQQELKARAHKVAQERVQEQLEAMEEHRRKETQRLFEVQQEQQARQKEELRRRNLERRRAIEKRQAECERERDLNLRRDRVATKLKIVERRARIKHHTAHADEWRAPTPQREFLQKLQDSMYNDDKASVFIRMPYAAASDKLGVGGFLSPLTAVTELPNRPESSNSRRTSTTSPDGTSRPSTGSAAQDGQTKSSIKLPSVSRSSTLRSSRPSTSAEHRAQAQANAATAATAVAVDRRKNARFRLHPQVRLSLQWLLGDLWAAQYQSHFDGIFKAGSSAFQDVDSRIRQLFSQRGEILDHTLRQDFVAVLQHGSHEEVKALMNNPTATMIHPRSGTMRRLLGASCLAWILSALQVARESNARKSFSSKSPTARNKVMGMSSASTSSKRTNKGSPITKGAVFFLEEVLKNPRFNMQGRFDQADVLPGLVGRRRKGSLNVLGGAEVLTLEADETTTEGGPDDDSTVTGVDIVHGQGRFAEKKRRQLEAQYAERHARVLRNEISNLSRRLKTLQHSKEHLERNKTDTKSVDLQIKEAQRSARDFEAKLARLEQVRASSVSQLSETDALTNEQRRETHNKGRLSTEVKRPPPRLELDSTIACPIRFEPRSEDSTVHKKRRNIAMHTSLQREDTPDTSFIRNEQVIFQTLTSLGWKEMKAEVFRRGSGVGASASPSSTLSAPVNDRRRKSMPNKPVSSIGNTAAIKLAVLLFGRKDFSILREDRLPASSVGILKLADAAREMAAERRAEKSAHFTAEAHELRLAGNMDAAAKASVAAAHYARGGESTNSARRNTGQNQVERYPGQVRRQSTVTTLEAISAEEKMEEQLLLRENIERRNAAAKECQRRAFVWVMQLDSEDAAIALFRRKEMPLDIEVDIPRSCAALISSLEAIGPSVPPTVPSTPRSTSSARSPRGSIVSGFKAIPRITPLQWAMARDFERLRDMLLLAQKRLPPRDCNGMTALMHAARLGLDGVAESLLGAGADGADGLINARDEIPRHEKTAYMYALEAAAQVDATPAFQLRCLSIATAIAGHRLFRLCGTVDALGQNCAMYAVASQNRFRAQLAQLLDLHQAHNARAEAHNESFDATFFACDAEGRSVITHAILAGSHQCVRDLVAYLVDLHQHEVAHRELMEKCDVVEEGAAPDTEGVAGSVDNDADECNPSESLSDISSFHSSQPGEKVASWGRSSRSRHAEQEKTAKAAAVAAAGGPVGPLVIHVHGGVLDDFVPPELIDSLEILKSSVGAMLPNQAVAVVNTLLRLGYRNATILPAVRYMVFKVLSNKACISFLVFGERHVEHNTASDAASAPNTSGNMKSAKTYSDPGVLDRSGRPSWSRMVEGALTHCAATNSRLSRAGARARVSLATLPKRVLKANRRRGNALLPAHFAGGRAGTPRRLGTPASNASHESGRSTPRSLQSSKGKSQNHTGIRLDLASAPPINHQLARQDHADLMLIPSTSGFSFGENGYIFLLVLLSIAQARAVHDQLQSILQDASRDGMQKFKEGIENYSQLVKGGLSGAMRKKRQQVHQTFPKDVVAADEASNVSVEELFSHKYVAAPCKTYRRMRHLFETRHRDLKRPRPAHNLDVIRGTAVFSSVDALESAFKSLHRKLPAIVSVRNDFSGSDGGAAKASAVQDHQSTPKQPLSLINQSSGKIQKGFWRQLTESQRPEVSLLQSVHPDDECLQFVDKEDGVLRSSGYRAIKLDFVFDANETYRQMAIRCEKDWKDFLICLPEGVQKDASSVLSFLFSDKVADRPVRMICELHLTLNVYNDLKTYNGVYHNIVKCARQGVSSLSSFFHDPDKQHSKTLEEKEASLVCPPSAHMKGARPLPTGVDYELEIARLPKIPKGGGVLIKTKGKGEKHPKQVFFESFDTNKSGALEQDEALRFVAKWYDVRGLRLLFDGESDHKCDTHTVELQKRFLNEYLEFINARIPLQFYSFLAILRGGPPDDGKKAKVQEIWDKLDRAFKDAAKKRFDEHRAAMAVAARRAAFAT